MFASVPAYFQGAGRWAAIALGASIPISVALDNVLFLVLVLAWLFGGGLREKLERVRESPAALAALALLGLLILGMAWGPGSAREGWHYVLKHKDLVLVAALGGIIARDRDRRLALGAFLAAMALTLVLSYAMWLGVLPVEATPNRGPSNPTVFKLHITHGVLMAFASFLAMIAALHAADRRWRVVFGAGALLAACNVFMVQGRTGYLVFAVLGAWLCFAYRRRTVVVGAVAATMVLLVAAVVGDASRLGRISMVDDEYREWNEGSQAQTSTGLRMGYYATTAAIVREHPILGVGTGGFVEAYREKIRGTSLPPSSNPHNQYLLTAAQLGIVGLAALLALFGAMWWQAGRLDPPAGVVARGLVLAFAAGCLLNSFLIDHVEGLLFAWMAGVLFATPREKP